MAANQPEAWGMSNDNFSLEEMDMLSRDNPKMYGPVTPEFFKSWQDSGHMLSFTNEDGWRLEINHGCDLAEVKAGIYECINEFFAVAESCGGLQT